MGRKNNCLQMYSAWTRLLPSYNLTNCLWQCSYFAIWCVNIWAGSLLFSSILMSFLFCWTEVSIKVYACRPSKKVLMTRRSLTRVFNKTKRMPPNVKFLGNCLSSFWQDVGNKDSYLLLRLWPHMDTTYTRGIEQWGFFSPAKVVWIFITSFVARTKLST